MATEQWSSYPLTGNSSSKNPPSPSLSDQSIIIVSRRRSLPAAVMSTAAPVTQVSGAVYVSSYPLITHYLQLCSGLTLLNEINDQWDKVSLLGDCKIFIGVNLTAMLPYSQYGVALPAGSKLTGEVYTAVRKTRRNTAEQCWINSIFLEISCPAVTIDIVINQR